MEGESTHAFSSGAKSSGKLPPFALIPWHIFAERLAARCGHGAEKYGEGNWEKGLSDREFVMDRANHLLEHVHKAVETIRTGGVSIDDDLAAVLWGAIFLMATQEKGVAEDGTVYYGPKQADYDDGIPF